VFFVINRCRWLCREKNLHEQPSPAALKDGLNQLTAVATRENLPLIFPMSAFLVLLVWFCDVVDHLALIIAGRSPVFSFRKKTLSNQQGIFWVRSRDSAPFRSFSD